MLGVTLHIKWSYFRCLNRSDALELYYQEPDFGIYLIYMFRKVSFKSKIIPKYLTWSTVFTGTFQIRMFSSGLRLTQFSIIIRHFCSFKKFYCILSNL